ncbi:ferredoxin [Flavonifractor sp. An92]|uniref:RnfABCDGE type electron transport complex subunit B n=1 Tax=Flavonifractor sp. An92 TaxID=1965666 RepID=UPI000B37CDB1|nr:MULTISPECIES: RnfABCDGE type electron transport complex subunit B [unclassified Flavonifractor]OUN07235.1 ferredoxin [Flavonifractor sp. An92]OUQ24380.1 ferredoxin [Flavonifractor sp. An135]
MDMTVIYALLVLGVLGGVFGLILAFASKAFAVEKDPREEAIAEVLPGANCGGCGYPGCAGYAAAVAAGKAATNCCAAGGDAVTAKISEIMGVKAEAGVKMIAQVQCTGGCRGHEKYEYAGIADCSAASRLPGGGPAGCSFGCLGFGTCEKVCPFDAIHVVDGVAKVDEDKCKACKKCIDACPRHIILLAPYKTKRHVAITCSSKDKGVVVRQVCDNGCIGCSLCAKACPKEAITVEKNLAVIDYDKCVGCGICAQKCPRKLITVDGKVPEVKPAAPKAAPAAAGAAKAE